jgi:hypothetical protein
VGEDNKLPTNTHIGHVFYFSVALKKRGNQIILKKNCVSVKNVLAVVYFIQIGF